MSGPRDHLGEAPRCCRLVTTAEGRRAGAPTLQDGSADLGLSDPAQASWSPCRTEDVKRLELRLQARRQEPLPAPLRTFRIQESCKLRHTPEQVWRLVAPAEHGVLLLPETVARGFRVPGTPEGLGEQQCFVDLDGNASIHEVIEYSEARYAVMRMISPASPIGLRATHRVEPLGDACILTIGMEFDAPADTTWTQDQQNEWRRGASQYVDRVRRTLAAETASEGRPGD
jgi:hypothetical protein